MAAATMVARPAAADAVTRADDAAWDRVISEFHGSCARRAADGQLFSTDNAVGILSGASPVLWVHGPGDGDVISAALAGAREVDDVYVSGAATATLQRLLAEGWESAGVMTQLVCEREGWSAGTVDGVRELGATDLPDFCQVLAAATGADDRLLASSYGPDFFERAHPAWLFGGFEAGRLVGTVGMRLQPTSAMVFALSVLDDHRGSGVASALVRTAIRRAFDSGAAFVHALAETSSLGIGLAAGARAVGTWHHLVRA